MIATSSTRLEQWFTIRRVQCVYVSLFVLIGLIHIIHGGQSKDNACVCVCVLYLYVDCSCQLVVALVPFQSLSPFPRTTTHTHTQADTCDKMYYCLWKQVNQAPRPTTATKSIKYPFDKIGHTSCSPSMSHLRERERERERESERARYPNCMYMLILLLLMVFLTVVLSIEYFPKVTVDFSFLSSCCLN